MSKTFLVMAGGTGGHIYPALAAAQELQAKGARVVWLGSRGGMEEGIVGKTGIPLQLLSVAGLRGKGFLDTMLGPLRLLRSLWQAFRVYRRELPDCVLGMGGFASGPGGLMALLTGTPLVIHEQNAIPGMTNSWLSKWAKRILQAFPDTFRFTSRRSERVFTVGNPVRKDLMDLPSPEDRNIGNRKPNILILGGSRGAKTLNELVPEALAKLPEDIQPTVQHQAGAGKDRECRELYASLGYEAEVTAFIENMRDAYAQADLVICRAGALTLSELACVGVAAVLVPYPYAVDDHQTANAKVLVNSGAAVLIQERDVTAGDLARLIRKLITSPSDLLRMADQARSQAQPDATQVVVRHCIEACI